MTTSKYQAKIVKMTDLTPDNKNANRGTIRGNAKLEDSIQFAGHGRAGLLDRNNKIIAGNKFYEKSGELGAEEAIVIESDGSLPIFVKRIDMSLDEDERARMLAYYDNAVAQMDLAWDEAQIAADQEAGLPLEMIWTPEEIASFLGIDEPPYSEDEEKRQNELEFILKIKCNDEGDLRSLYDRLVSEGLTCDMEIN